MSESPQLVCRLFSATPLDPRQYAEPLFSILEGWRFRPAKCGDSEPLRTRWGDCNKFCQLCLSCASTYFGPVMIEWSSPRLSLMVMHMSGPNAKAHSLDIVSPNPNELGGAGAPYLIELADTLFSRLRFTYGFACISTEYDDNNIIAATYRDGVTVRPLQVVGMEWPDCLPGFYWCNYFGDAYLSHGFGDAVRCLPNTTMLPNGIRVLRSASPLNWDLPDEQRKTAELVAACGVDWFYSKHAGMPTKSLHTDKTAFRSPLNLKKH